MNKDTNELLIQLNMAICEVCGNLGRKENDCDCEQAAMEMEDANDLDTLHIN